MESGDIKRIAVIGAGLMGHGIAQEFALAGYDVRLHDLTEEKLQSALQGIRENLETLARTGLAPRSRTRGVEERIRTSTTLDDVLVEVDVVIEAVFENLELKQRIFRELDAKCPKRTILASNTSTLLPSALASGTQRPDRVLVAHYFNPPHLLPLVEVVRGPGTSDETVATLCALLKEIGKQPAIIQREVPGFIGNRLQGALLREAISIVEHGIASPEDVDIVVRNSFGRRLSAAGVFEVFELAGLDLVLAACSYLIPHLESSTEPSSLLKEKVARGELGVRTGKGFYEWTPESADALRQRIARALVEISRWEQPEGKNA